MTLSQTYKTVGIGQVASNKQFDSDTIEVFDIELSSLHDGAIASNPQELTVDYTDSAGNTYSTRIVSDTPYPADWLPGVDTHHLRAPDVCVGELIEILTIADSGQYYWRTLGKDTHLRTLETVILAIACKPGHDDVKLTPDNSYWIEWSSHSKKLVTSNTKNNGDPFLHQVILDYGEGISSIVDDIGQHITLNSKERLVELLNADQSRVSLIRKNIEIEAQETVSIKAKKVIVNGGGSIMTWMAGITTLVTAFFQGKRG